MLYSLNWIRDYVDVDEDPHALAHRLTMAGLAVESVETVGDLPEGVVVGHVLETRKHPNADRLTLCTVDIGSEEPLSIVCGAPNVRPGIYSPIATVGTVLPGGLKIKKSKIRGEVSRGMICSEIELGLGDDADGIMELPETPIGTPYAQVLGPPDTRFDVDVPSNRGDALSHIGLAREIAALTGKPLRLPQVTVEAGGDSVADGFAVEVESPEDCPRFTAHRVRGITVGPSPAWLVRRLESVGQRSINNVVDVTNFVMLEMGQPLHAFDMDRLGTGKILVRRARPGERIRTLDGTDRNLTPEVLLITDGERPIAVGGVMGGANTEVVDATTDVLLEAAWFRPERVLRGSRELRMDTDAAIRFRRGVDPAGVARAAQRAAVLLAEVGGGTVAPGMVEVADPALDAPRTVALRPERVGAVIGDSIPDAEVAERLISFGFAVDRDTDPWSVNVPSWRRDIFEDCDLVEEVARHRGYDSIGTRAYNASAVRAAVQPEELRRRQVGEVMRGLGYSEALTRTLVDTAHPERAQLVGDAAASFFRVLDPPTREEEGLRLSLLPSLIQSAAHNVRHGSPQVRLFEVGKAFRRSEGPMPVETEWVGLVATGGDFPPSLERQGRSLDFLGFKGVVEALLAAFRIDRPKWRPYNGLDFVPKGALEAVRGEESVAMVWEADRATREHWDLGRPLYAAQVRLSALPLDSGVPVRYREPSRFPAVRRDLALIVPHGVEFGQVRQWIRDEGGSQLTRIELFDRYTGKHIPEGHVGLGLRLTFRSPERTLEEQEVDAAIERVVAALDQQQVIRRRETTL